MKSRNDEVLDILLSYIENRYKKDISLVCCYGSYVNGTANEKSDVDFYFIPKTERAYEAAMTFIVDGVGYDFWPISWERLERIARFEDTFVSLLEGAKIVYCSDEEDKEKFNSLLKQVTMITEAPRNDHMLSMAQSHLNKAKAHYFDLLLVKDKKQINLKSGAILLEVSDALCLMNNRFFKFGTKKHLVELASLAYQSDNFQEDYKNIIQSRNSPEVIDRCQHIITHAQVLLDDLRKKLKKAAGAETLTGLYEEICSNWNKLYSACDNMDAGLAFITGVYLQNTLDEALSSCGMENIDFLSEYSSADLSRYKKAAEKAEGEFLSCLALHNIPVNTYKTAEEFRISLYSNKTQI
jgi:predicted nucleotidyltransferase